MTKKNIVELVEPKFVEPKLAPKFNSENKQLVACVQESFN